MDLRRALRPLLLTAWLAALVGCAANSSTSSANPKLPPAVSTAQLRNGDSLTISVQGVPDPSVNTVQIDDRGTVSLPFIGSIAAAGLNAGELSERIRQTYIERKFYNTVDVSVSVTERYVYVGGEVEKPGRIIWTPDLTAAKAIQSAGGFTLYAKETRVNLVRDQQTYLLDVKLAQKSPAQDPALIPGDSLQVPRSPF